MYSLNWHRSFDVCKLVDARRRASTRSVWMLPIFNISLIGRVDTLGVNGALASRELPPTCTCSIVSSDFDLLTSKQVNRLWWASIVIILGFLGLSVLELGRSAWHMDRYHLSFHNASSKEVGGITIFTSKMAFLLHNKQCIYQRHQ